jgi:CheY-like chemotaxis protein
LSDDREKAISAGCNDYLAKPINLNDLKSMLAKYI